MDENDLIQLPLWSDDELPEPQQPTQDENQDAQQDTARSEPWMIQLYLPGFESE